MAWLNVPSAISAPTIQLIRILTPIDSAAPSTNHVISVISAPATRALTRGRARVRPAAPGDRRGLPRDVAAAAEEACAEAGEPRTVVLSGGTFQNLRLLGSTTRRLEQHGFRVLTHRLVPSNDGGIGYGQAAIAATLRL
jgi:hypothetical protein